ncbi:MAG: hypothetical protein LBU46_01495, partial [Candidatus Accumulibacter sp.]|nr:hypothetical protein [Accumulibacter sp.]
MADLKWFFPPIFSAYQRIVSNFFLSGVKFAIHRRAIATNRQFPCHLRSRLVCRNDRRIVHGRTVCLPSLSREGLGVGLTAFDFSTAVKPLPGPPLV